MGKVETRNWYATSQSTNGYCDIERGTFSNIKAEQTQEPKTVIRLKPAEMNVHNNCQNLGSLHTILEESKNSALFSTAKPTVRNNPL